MVNRGTPYTIVYHGGKLWYNCIPWYTIVYHGIPW